MESSLHCNLLISHICHAACSDADTTVPVHVEELVAMDNSRFEHWVTQVNQYRVRSQACCLKQKHVSTLFALDDLGEFIETSIFEFIF